MRMLRDVGSGRLRRFLVGPSEAEIRAAAPAPPPRLLPSVAYPPNGWGTGGARLAPASMDFAPPVGVFTRDAAMQIPTVARARNTLCGALGALPLTLWRFNTTGTAVGPPVEQALAPASWMARPDPLRSRNWILSWTTDDLIFHGRAYWRVTDRYASTNGDVGWPKAFQWMPAARVSVDRYGQLTFDDAEVADVNVIEFLSPLDGVLATGWYAIDTTMRLDAAARRFASNNVPQGWLKQIGGEPMGVAGLVELVAGWDAQRESNATGALNTDVEYHESSYDPARLQLVEARQQQALELARVMNVPPYLVGAPQGTGMTYQNTVQAKADLIDFGALPYVNCIEQTLGGPNVVPRGQFVRLDLNVYLRNPYVSGFPAPNDMQTAFNPDSAATGPAASPPPAGGRPRQFDQRSAA